MRIDISKIDDNISVNALYISPIIFLITDFSAVHKY